MKKIINIMVVLVLLCSCNYKNTETKAPDIAQLPISNSLVAREKTVKQESGTEFSKIYEEQSIQSTSNDTVSTLLMRSSSVIHVKKNTFVYADDNKPVTEPVIIQYREIKQASDAIASSISMIYDSAGVKNNFESAGMFEFYARAKSSGRIVKIAKGKSVDIDFVTDAKDDDYNFYKYQPDIQNWTYLSRASSSIKVTKVAQNAVVELPVLPNRPSKNGTAFDLDIDVDKFPELKSYRGIVWEYASETKADNPAKNKWIFAENWDNVNLETYTKSTGCYKITLMSKKKTFSTVIKPALTGNDYNQAMQKYQKALARYQKFQSSKSKVMKLKINDFGIYNIDRIATIKNSYTIEADFELENSTESLADKTVYLVYNQNRNVISYTKSGLNSWRKFTFDTKATDNKLLVIFANNKIAIGSSKDFEIIKKQNHKSYRFKLKLIDKSIESIADLNGLF